MTGQEGEVAGHSGKAAGKSYIREWELRDLSEPVGQGDVFRWLGASADCWKSFGVVITADCDVAHGKHWGVLSYCPVIGMRELLRLFWVRADVTKAKQAISERIGRLLKQVPGPLGSAKLERDDLMSWLTRRGPQGVADDLELAAGVQRETLVSELTTLAAMVQLDDFDVDRLLDLAVAARLGAGEPVEKRMEKRRQLVANYVGRVASMPGDLFPLSELGADTRGGFVVYLRRIGELDESALAVTPAQQASGDCQAVRISRLSSPFRYRLTQQLAAVFADIGLPDRHIENCSSDMRNMLGAIIDTGLKE